MLKKRFLFSFKMKHFQGVDMLIERRPSREGRAEDPGEIRGLWLGVGKKMGRGRVGGGRKWEWGRGGGMRPGQLINLYASIYGCTYRQGHRDTYEL